MTCFTSPSSPLWIGGCHNINVVCTRKIKYSIFEKHGKDKFAFGLIHFAFWLRNFGGMSGHCHSLCCSCSWVSWEGHSPTLSWNAFTACREIPKVAEIGLLLAFVVGLPELTQGFYQACVIPKCPDCFLTSKNFSSIRATLNPLDCSQGDPIPSIMLSLEMSFTCTKPRADLAFTLSPLTQKLNYNLI